MFFVIPGLILLFGVLLIVLPYDKYKSNYPKEEREKTILKVKDAVEMHRKVAVTIIVVLLLLDVIFWLAGLTIRNSMLAQSVANRSYRGLNLNNLPNNNFGTIFLVAAIIKVNGWYALMAGIVLIFYHKKFLKAVRENTVLTNREKLLIQDKYSCRIGLYIYTMIFFIFLGAIFSFILM